jgi:hypothetical protein
MININDRHKGYIYTLEVMIAVVIIFMAFVFVYKFPPTKPAENVGLIKQQGFNALKYLDDRGLLRQIAYSSDNVQLRAQLDSLLKSVNYGFDICTTSCQLLDPPRNMTVVSIEYYISGYMESYKPRKIMLWMWERY